MADGWIIMKDKEPNRKSNVKRKSPTIFVVITSQQLAVEQLSEKSNNHGNLSIYIIVQRIVASEGLPEVVR